MGKMTDLINLDNGSTVGGRCHLPQVRRHYNGAGPDAKPSKKATGHEAPIYDIITLFQTEHCYLP